MWETKHILSLSKAYYVPNGIDFGKLAERYTNGRTIAAIVGKLRSLLYSVIFTSIVKSFASPPGFSPSYLAHCWMGGSAGCNLCFWRYEF